MGRRFAVLLAVCLALPALALAANGEPKKRIVAADQKRAVAIVLKRNDLAAGWKRVRTPESGEDLRCPGFNPDESDLTLTGESESEFESTDGTRYVASFSSVYVSLKDAVASWTRSAKPALARCVAHFFREGIAEEGGKATIVAQGRMAFPRLAPRTIALRVAARVTFTEAGKSTTIPFTIQLIGLGRGRGDAGLMAMSPGAGIPSAELRAFGKLLAQRLQKSGL